MKQYACFEQSYWVLKNFQPIRTPKTNVTKCSGPIFFIALPQDVSGVWQKLSNNNAGPVSQQKVDEILGIVLFGTLDMFSLLFISKE